MIKTIRIDNAIDFEKLVNGFEKQCTYPTGVTRVFATQTHFTHQPGCMPEYIAIIFYKGDEYVQD